MLLLTIQSSLCIQLFLLYFSSHCFMINNSKQCSIRDSCSNSSSSSSPSIYGDETYIQSRNCFCDSICHEYGDCCNQTMNSNLNYYECTDFLSPTINNTIPSFSPLSVWMRTKCLSNYIGSPSDIQCQNLNQETFFTNPLLFIPVTSLQTNITYRNYFCAYCNNDANNNYLKFWYYRTFCHGNGSIFDYLILNNEEKMNYYIYNLTRNCVKTIRYPHLRGKNEPIVFIRPCKKSLPPSCPSETSKDLARNCSLSGPAYRYDIIDKVIYHNSYCAKCNNINNHLITCLDPILQSSMTPLNHIRAYPLSILFDPNIVKNSLNLNSNINIIYSLAYKCKKSNQLYNLFLKKCSQITHSNKEIIISMKCSYPIQIINDYIQFNNQSLYLINQSILLTKDEYVFINNNQIILCMDKLKQIINPPPKFPFYRHILSIICTSISLFCLFIFFISFWLIQSLHNLPGKCLLFLSISLFIGQLTFILTSDLMGKSSLCFIAGIIIHYFYLSSFLWLLIIAIQIHSTFTQQIIQRDQIKTKYFRLFIYNIFVWCSAGIIILIACLLQFIEPESNFSPNYGFLFCSISTSNAMILFFLLPIGCLLLSVVILFFRTILAIYHSHQIAKLASNSSTNTNNTTTTNDFKLIFVYVRLASLMGLQWFLLIIALIIRQTWSWIIFEIINSLPGVFICFGFLYSQRLWNDIKQRISISLINRRQSSKSNTTSTSLMSPTTQR